MKRNLDPRIDAYIKNAAGFAQPVLRHLRDRVHQACPDVDEALKWGNPSFLLGGKIVCFMAAFKAHCAFGFWHHEMRSVIARETGTSDEAMGLMGRITGLDDLPADRTLLRYLRQAAKLAESDLPARPAPKPKKDAVVPGDLAAALKKNKAAAQAFAKFSPSHRREYVEWITEAKRDETRQKRLATTLEWLAEGKPRNWKYMNC